MADPQRTDRIVRFGDFEIDRTACELRREGQRIPLQIQPFRVLEALIDRAGEVVTREELRATVWPATVYVDFNHGLNNAVTRLRRALEESSDSPKYIETLPRIGFRFIHTIEQSDTRPRHVVTSSEYRAAETWVGAALVAAILIGVIGVNLARWAGFKVEASRHTMTTSQPTTNAEAYEAYLRGLELFEQRSKESIELSIEYLTRATTLDPDFAAAYSALAMSYTVAGGNTLARYLSAEEARPPALAAVERALQLDPGLAPAHTALATVLNHLQPWSAATDVAIEQSYRRALVLDSGDAQAYLFLGNFLSTRDRNDEAFAQFLLAKQLDPLSPSINSRLGMELVTLGRLEEGLAYLRKTVELDPWQFNAHIRLGWAYIGMDDLEAAHQEFESADRISPVSLRSLAGLAYIAARKGDVQTSRTLLEGMLPLAEDHDDPFDVAIVYVGLGEREKSIEWLAKTVSQTQSLRKSGPWGTQTSIYDWLRDDARFAQIERDIAMKARPVASRERTR